LGDDLTRVPGQYQEAGLGKSGSMTWSAEAQRPWTRPKQPIGSAVTLVIFTLIPAAHLVLAIVAAGAVLVTFVFTTTGGKHSRPSRSVPVQVSP
jgi:hypothetical protein